MNPRRRTTVAGVLLATIGVAGCGSAATAPIAPSSRLVHAGTRTGKIILSQLGAQRIGIRISRARVARGSAVKPTAARRTSAHAKTGPAIHAKVASPRAHSEVTVPYSAVVYAPSGKTYVFSNPARLTYTELPVTVSHINGQVVFLTRGPRPGTRIVTVGAEELYGVQSGVLAQT